MARSAVFIMATSWFCDLIEDDIALCFVRGCSLFLLVVGPLDNRADRGDYLLLYLCLSRIFIMSAL